MLDDNRLLHDPRLRELVRLRVEAGVGDNQRVPDYDFRSLSAYDFQLLSRDLLQAELTIRLESFSAGPDGGIDLRNQTRGLIVQCKHFADSSYAKLLSVLRNVERPKVESLEPERYILVTSQGLTPARKSEIRNIFHPFCFADDDVFGRDDLNNLLGRHPRIEEQNFKLWLTSENVLRRIVRAGAVEDTQRAVERIRAKTRRYVNTPSFRRALDILDRSHYCIIAGIPGIGKTTLAEVLLVHYVDRHDFEPVRISYDLSEVVEAARWDARQVFYFDDFLGRTTLDKLKRNEDQRLMEFMREVADNPRWRFILTTREYILNRARMRYETLATADLELETCVLDLGDYSHEARAAILYNHIYFSDLDVAFKRALLETRAYRAIAFHQNYSPRIVEHMTTARNLVSYDPGQYAHQFVSALENPTYIWRHAFEEQLSPEAQNLLLVLGSFPDEILLSDAEDAYHAFSQRRRDRYATSGSPREFEHALKELDGNFTSTTRLGHDIFLEFHNPSVTDFLTHYLSEHVSEVRDLIDSALFFEQCEHLARGPKDTPSRAAAESSDALASALRRLFGGRTSRLIRSVEGITTIKVFQDQPTPFDRGAALVEIADIFGKQDINRVAEDILQTLAESARNGEGDRLAYASVVRAVANRRERSSGDESFLLAAKAHIFSGQTLDDFHGMAAFWDESPGIVSAADLTAAGERFAVLCEGEAEYAEQEGSDPEELHSLADKISYVAERLGAVEQTADAVERIREAANELSSQEPDDPEPERDWHGDTQPRFNIDEMFDGLLHDLSALDTSDES